MARSVDKNAKNETATSNVNFVIRTLRRIAHKQTATLRNCLPPTPRPLDKPSISEILTSSERNNALCLWFENNNYYKKADILYVRPLCITWCNLCNARNVVACFSWQFASHEHVVNLSFPQIVDSPSHFLRYT